MITKKLKLTCSKCGICPITGIKYKCITCSNYFLCEKCEKIFGQKHGHWFLKIRKDEYFEKYKIKLSNEDEPTKINLTDCKFKLYDPHQYYETRNNNNSYTINLKIQNNGNIQWPFPCFLTCLENESDIIGKKVKLSKISGLPGETIITQIKLDLSFIKETGVYFSKWEIQAETGESFGEKINIAIKDIFDQKLSLKKNNYNYQCLNKNLIFNTKNNNNSLPVNITIKNNGNIDWPNPFFLICDKENSDITGEKVKFIKFSGRVGEIITIKLNLDLSKIKKTGKYFSKWKIMTENDEKIGDEIVIQVNDNFDEKLKVKDFMSENKNTIKDYRDDLEKMVDEIKQEYDILFNISNIRNALIRCQGNKQNAIKMLFSEKERKNYYHK